MKFLDINCKRLFMMLLVVLPLMSWGQGNGGNGFVVKGIVADSLTMQGEPYATIRIYHAGDRDEAVVMFVSDESGAFSENLPAKGSYDMVVSSVGKRTLEKTFSVSSPVTSLGTILLSENVEELGEVSVVAKKPLVKVDMDKIAYDVDEDPDAQGKTVLEMMRKVPMITVDGQDNISVAGKSSFKIYVNGKPNNMMTNNPKEVLKSMPASSVKNIEVITNPGAKYDAEGTGGIINIITVGKTIDGYTVNVNANYSSISGYGGSLYGITQVGKFSVSGNYGYNRIESFPLSGNIDMYYGEDSPMASLKTMYDDMDVSGSFQNAAINASYEFDSLNLVSLSGSFYAVDQYIDYISGSRAMMRDGSEAYYYDLLCDNNYKYKGGNLSVDYQHTSPRNKAETFIFSYRLDASPTEMDLYMDMDEARNYEEFMSHQYSRGKGLENTFQADYTLPFKDIHAFNFGAKYIYRINDSRNLEERRDSPDDAWTLQQIEGTGDNRHRQHVLGIYGEYNLRYKKLGLKAGVRYEYTTQDVEFDNFRESNYAVDFSDVVPSLLLSYTLGTSQNLSLGYNMRIGRPGISYLNPFRNSSLGLSSVQFGNPDLDTEHYHNLSLSYGTFTPDFTINLTGEYSFCNDGITTYTFVDNDGVLNSTYDNIARSHVAGLNMYMNWNPSGSTRITLNGDGRYNWLSSNGNNANVAGMKNKGFSFNAHASLNQNFPWKLEGGAYGGYGTGGIALETVKQIRYYYYGLWIQRSFLKDDRLTLNVNVQNFAPRYQDMAHEKCLYDGSVVKSMQRQRMFNYMITLSYRIGEFKSSVKKAVKSIVNSDVVGGSAKGGGMK